jgi:hypothetical protein
MGSLRAAAAQCWQREQCGAAARAPADSERTPPAASSTLGRPSLAIMGDATHVFSPLQELHGHRAGVLGALGTGCHSNGAPTALTREL